MIVAMRLRIGLLLAAAALLAACAPTTEPGSAEARVTGPVSFYPRETGLAWKYLPEGLPLDSPGYVLKVEGLGSFLGETTLRFRFTGRGQDRVFHRQVGDLGVRLVGYEELITLSRVEFHPAFMEYPPESLLAVGYRWGGRTTIHSYFALPQGTEEQTRIVMNYSFEVMDHREVTVPAGRFKAYIIAFRAQSEKETLESEIWFAPHVGELRTREGLLLIGKNF